MTAFATRSHSDEQGAIWDRLYEDAVNHNVWGMQPLPAASIASAFASKIGATRIVDCACGDGRNLTTLAEASTFVVGTDVSRVALTHAEARLRTGRVKNAVLLRDNILESDVSSDMFDLVVALEVLSHLPDISVALNELVRICRPDGVIVTDVFSTTDATRGDRSDMEFVDERGIYFRYYEYDQAERLCKLPRIANIEIQALSWTDPPHGHYRPYEHVHTTWCMVLRKD